MTSSVKQKAVRGIKWVAFSRYAQKGLSVLTFIILARLLEPEVFGLFAMAFIVIDGLGLFKNIGVDSALVQRKEDIERASHTAFWMMPFLGAVIFAILYFISPMAALVLKEPALTPIIRTLGLIFVLGAIENIPASLLNKELKFKELAIRELVSSVLFSLSAVIFAFLKFGVWSLVYAYLIKRVSMFFFSWTLSPYRPKFIFDKKIANELLHFGKFIFCSSIVGFFILNTDNFLVGRSMGTAVLGFYALAYNISSMTTAHLSALVHRVMFPVYSKMQDSKSEIKNITLKIIKVLAMISFPFGIGLMLFSTEVIGTVYGQKWLPLVPALKALALCSMLLPVMAMSQSVFVACGKPKWSFYLRLPVIFGMVILIPIMSRVWGLLGVAIAVCFSKLCVFPFVLVLMKKIINLSFSELFKALKPIFIASFFMILSGHAFKRFMGNIAGDFSFIIYGSLTVLVYIFILHKLDRKLFSGLKRNLINDKEPDLKIDDKYGLEKEI